LASTEPPAPQETTVSWDTVPYHHAAFAVGKSRRYHEMMANFHEQIANAITWMNIILSSTALLSLFGDPKSTTVAKICSGLVVVLSASEKTFKPLSKSRHHDGLRRRFIDLAIIIEKTPANPKGLEKIKAKRLEIEKDERPVCRLIDLIAVNEEMGARGYPQDDLIPLSWMQRHFGYFGEFGMARLERWREQQRLKGRVDRNSA